MMLHGPSPVVAPELDLARRTRWQLTREAFEALLVELASGGRQATAEYERLHRRLVAFFERRGWVDADACADETLDRVARRLQQGDKIENVRRYAYGVARFVALELARERTRRRAALAGRRLHGPMDAATDLRLIRLEQQLAQMTPETRRLLIEYYQTSGRSPEANRKHLAERMGISYVALKVRVHRARTLLEDRLRSSLDATQ
jgi:DNA-directed RNA polymerase specialized sigma24 family protein